jgi:hypothetical protein
MNHAETLAKTVIETILPNSKMSFREDQSQGGHDYDLYLSDGRICAVEVTASVDQIAEQTRVAILDSKKGKFTIMRVLCKKDWLIHPTSGASINLIRRRVDEYLSAIEMDGIERFFSATDPHPSVKRILLELGIESGAAFEFKERGHMLSLPGEGGAVGPQRVFEAVKREAFKIDNRSKLQKAGTEERHLAVYIDQGNFLPWHSLISFSPQPVPPDLPAEITHIWAFTEALEGENCVVWHAYKDSRWSRIEIGLARNK